MCLMMYANHKQMDSSESLVIHGFDDICNMHTTNKWIHQKSLHGFDICNMDSITEMYISRMTPDSDW